jgi:hypothetical protein
VIAFTLIQDRCFAWSLVVMLLATVITVLTVGLAVVATTTAAIVAFVVSVTASKGNNVVDEDALANLVVPQDTLFALLQAHLVPMGTVRRRGYDKVLRLVELLIGVQPISDMVLQIWQPAYEAYVVIPPNFLNLPELLFGLGIRPKQLVSIAGYISSRANDCAYCTAHTCSFALRRGARITTMEDLVRHDYADISSPSPSSLSAQDLAVAKVAYGLGKVPSSLESIHVQSLYRVLSPGNVEWIVATIAMFGSFNKLMDGLGVPLEPSCYKETRNLLDAKWIPGKAGQMIEQQEEDHIEPTPKPDDWKTLVSAVYLGLCPGGGMAVNRKLLAGMPTTPSEAMAMLDKTVGHAFPAVFTKLTHSRFIGAIAKVIHLNFSSTAGFDTKAKVLAGVIFAHTVQNKILLEDIVAVGLKSGVSQDDMDTVLRHHHTAPPSAMKRTIVRDDDPILNIAIDLAKALSTSPCQVNERLVGSIRALLERHVITPPMLVEIVSFIAMLQMLHRIEMFYALS